ncbi:hypothetical protein CISIN_1g041144mg, partial [Citrus sinensis]
WRHSGPPIFDKVNKLFEEGRTKEWPKGSIEETVQNAVKSWEMELSHKTSLNDFKTINPEKFKLIVNGRKGLSREESLQLGSYNALLNNSMEETFKSSHDAFRSAFPRGFAWELISVYSGPPMVAYKFKHWGYFEGPFQGHAPTGEMVEFLWDWDYEDVEIYYHPAELFAGLFKGPVLTPIAETQQNKSADASTSHYCPFSE